MNRIILIGNGFDLAHGLKTSYANFIDWYWDKRIFDLRDNYSKVSKDVLCTITTLSDNTWQYFYWLNQSVLNSTPGKEVIKQFLADKANYQVTKSDFFSRILYSYQEKGWVDIENEYYRLLFPPAGNGPFPYKDNPKELNQELAYVRDLLIEYLNRIKQEYINESVVNQCIKEKLFAPFYKSDFAIESSALWNDIITHRCSYPSSRWKDIISSYSIDVKKIGEDYSKLESFLRNNREIIRNSKGSDVDENRYPNSFFLPDRILLLNFNYTNTADLYGVQNGRFVVNHIHGELSNPNSVIFGYGDELDENYKKMSEKNENEYLQNIKSIKYLESTNYRNMLGFIESDSFQVYIMGHSCGNSDRTLLNTLFEHKNCVSIKPFYYIRKDGTDNYMELVQNISRNFTDMKLMRDRVVNKTFCEAYSDMREISSSSDNGQEKAD